MYRIQSQVIQLSDVSSGPVAEFDISSQWGYCYQLSWVESGATGDINVQLSNDDQNWVNIPTLTVNIAALSAGFFNVGQAFYRKVRLDVVVSSGTLTSLDVAFHSKG